jgi:GAF domain-containing protein
MGPQIAFGDRSMVVTHRLRERPAHALDQRAIQRTVLHLTQLMAKTPHDVLQRLAETLLEICAAHSSGVSVLEGSGQDAVFRWHGMAGKLRRFRGAATPRQGSPCGIVLDERRPLLVEYPERHHSYDPSMTEDPIVEALLAPFACKDEPVGTVWVIAHDESRKFDSADLQALCELALFASSAYDCLTSAGYLQRSRDRRSSIQSPTITLRPLASDS